MSVLVGSLLGLVGALVTVEPANADESATPVASLPISQYADSAYDATRDLLYVSGDGQSDDSVLVVHSDGTAVTQVALPAPAVQLSLSPDGSTLYASLPSLGEIAAIDTSSWSVHELDTGTGSCPTDLAAVGSAVFFSDIPSCSGSTIHLMELDPSSGTVTEPFPDLNISPGNLEPVPGHPWLMVDLTNQTEILDLSGAQPSVLANAPFTFLRHEPKFTPDGSSVIVGRSVYSLPDLTQTGTLPGGISAPDAVDATTLTVEDRVYDASSGALLNTIQLGSDEYWQVRREYLSGGRLLALVDSGSGLDLFDVADPGTPAPTITAQATDAVVMHAATVGGTVMDQGQPVSGTTVDVLDADSGQQLASTTTASDGSWSIQHTWTTTGTRWLEITTSAVTGHKSAVDYLEVDVAPPTFTLSAPATATPNTPITVTGTVTSVGQPLGDTDFEWAVHCEDDPGYNDMPWAEGYGTTADDGSFSATVDPVECVHVRISFAWGDLGYPTSQDTHVDVTVPWKTAVMTLDLPDADVYVGDHVHAMATYTVDGKPVSGVSVLVWVLNPGLNGTGTTETTDAQGQVPIDFDASSAGAWQANLSAAATTDTLRTGVSDGTFAHNIPTSIVSSVTQSPVRAGDPVVVTGTISRARGPIAGVPLHLLAKYENGSGQREYDTTTDAQGTFSFTDVSPVAGAIDYTVSYAGDGALYPAATTAPMTVHVVPLNPTVTLASDRSTYDAGDVAHLHLGLTQSLTGHVVVTAYPGQANAASATSGGTVIFDGQVPDSGVTIDYPVDTLTSFRADAPADGSQTWGSADLTVGARMSMTTKALAPAATTAGGVAVYSVRSRPGFSATTRPRRDVCERFVVQRRGFGGWDQVARSGCLSAQAPETYHLTRGRTTGALYRIRTEFPGDALNLASHSGWVRFEFGRPR